MGIRRPQGIGARGCGGGRDSLREALRSMAILSGMRPTMELRYTVSMHYPSVRLNSRMVMKRLRGRSANR